VGIKSTDSGLEEKFLLSQLTREQDSSNIRWGIGCIW